MTSGIQTRLNNNFHNLGSAIKRILPFIQYDVYFERKSMKENKKLFVSIFATVLSLLIMTFLIYKYWNTSFPYGLYVEMSEITWQLFAFVFLDGFTLFVTFVNLYNYWLKGDKDK